MKLRRIRLRPKRLGKLSDAAYPANKATLIFYPTGERSYGQRLYRLNIWRIK